MRIFRVQNSGDLLEIGSPIQALAQAGGKKRHKAKLTARVRWTPDPETGETIVSVDIGEHRNIDFNVTGVTESTGIMAAIVEKMRVLLPEFTTSYVPNYEFKSDVDNIPSTIREEAIPQQELMPVDPLDEEKMIQELDF